MFNLIMGPFAASRMDVNRVFEFTDTEVGHFFMPVGPHGRTRLESLPALVLPELQERDPAFALVGHIEGLSLGADAREWRYRFVSNPAVNPIPLALIREHADELQIEGWEGNRTHWAIKPVELYRAVAAMGATSPVAPSVFKLPTALPRDPDLVAVMMPFAGFAEELETLRSAATEAGMRAVRVDDIWEKEHILDDILSLIWRANVVVADFTNKNANVFYEAGIAHTIGRTVIPIAQSMDHVPFDLQGIRTLTYMNNGEGRDKLKEKLVARLNTLRTTNSA